MGRRDFGRPGTNQGTFARSDRPVCHGDWHYSKALAWVTIEWRFIRLWGGIIFYLRCFPKWEFYDESRR